MKRIALFAVTVCLVAAGCSSTAEAPEGTAGDMAPAAEPTAEMAAEPTAEMAVEPTADTAAMPTTDAAASTMAKVSANNATEEELIAAFTAAGIDNAEKWADEVVEYRPYPTDDPNFTALREELAKYNPAPGVIDQIVAILEP